MGGSENKKMIFFNHPLNLDKIFVLPNFPRVDVV